MTEKPQITKSEFSGLVRESQAGLRTFIRMQGIEADAVDDIAQETYITAFERIGKFARDTYFLAWVKRIAINIISNERRKQAGRSRIMNTVIVNSLAIETAPDKDTVSLDEMRNALRDCIKELPPKSRDMIGRRYSGGQNSTNLAEYFDMSSVAVRKALMKIRNGLQNCIEGKVGKVEL